MSDLPFPSDTVDALIAARLPAWLTDHGRVDRLLQLHQALRRQASASAALGKLLQRIPALDEFAADKLVEALRRAGVANPDLRRSHVIVEHERITLAKIVGWPIPRYADRSSSSLLSAALHNFHISETRPSSLRRGNVVDAAGKHLIGYLVFAGMCRSVDVGGRYQALLAECLAPEDPPEAAPGHARAQVHRCFEESQQASLEVDLRCALFKGDVDERCYMMLLPQALPAPVVPLLPGDVSAWQPYLLGKQLRGVLAFELRSATDAALQALVAWIPGDRQAPVSQHRSWPAFYQTLATRLRNAQYRRFFERFISERDRILFQQTLARRLGSTEPGKSLELDGRHLRIEGAVWEYGRRLRIDTLIDDARVLATPTGEEDQRDRIARLQSYAQAGLNLLSLAGLFVPVLGQLMLGAGAVALADEIYEGYQDWRIGDREAALQHLFSVAETVIGGVLVAAGGAAVATALERHPFVDALQPVPASDGRIKLASAQLHGYALAATGEGSPGWLWQQGNGLYRVLEDARDGRPRIRHPQRDKAYAPLLEHNGADGWRHELERPQSWEGSELLQRFSARLGALSDEAADYLLRITGFEQAQLRRLHLEQVPAPPRLLDALDLYQIHQGEPGLRGHALDQALSSFLGAGGGTGAILARAFPGLSLREVVHLLDQCSSAELAQMLERGRVPLALAERARWQLRESRLDRALAGLQLPRAANADSEVLALGLIHTLCPWPAEASVELRLGSETGQLLAQVGNTEARQPGTIVRHDGGYRVVGADDQLHSLAGAVRRSLSEGQYAMLQHWAWDDEALANWLTRNAAADRTRAARFCGIPASPGFRPPQRLADGRLGYPLSGRGAGSRQALRCGIQRIFPTLSDDEVQEYLLHLVSRGENFWEHYTQLQAQLQQLRASLSQWQGSGSGLFEGLRRRNVERALRRSWRRKIINARGEYVVEIDGEAVGSLPQLPAGIRYDHIQRLSLRDMNLSDITDDFLSRFANVVELDLSRNLLTRIPPGVGQLRHLRILRLQRNQIGMDPAGQACLGQLVRLQRLDLGHNPLGHAPLLTGLHNLRDVGLRGTGLHALPEGIPARASVDLRDNAIREVREDLRQLRLRLDTLALHDNPLDAASEGLLDEARGGQGTPVTTVQRTHAVETDALRYYVVGSNTRQRQQRQAIWEVLQGEPESGGLFRFLADFAHSEDFEASPGHYRPRIWRILEACEQYAALRQRLFLVAAGPRTCEDRLLLTLEQLELAVLVERASGEGPVHAVEKRLYELAQGLWRLDEVDRIATRHIADLRSANTVEVDDIEVRLFFRLELADRLHLPIEPETMYFPEFAHVRRRDIDQAYQQVIQAETPQLLAQSLAERPYWETYAREHHAARFEEAFASLHARMEVLDRQLTEGQINEWDFTQGCQALKGEYERCERELLLAMATELQARLQPSKAPADS
ncbi:TPA: NEL-type E3 ubiquitin ligase domain-containing protein [Pseudomonas putida]